MENNEKLRPIAFVAKNLLEPYKSNILPISSYVKELENYENNQDYDKSKLLAGVGLAKLILHYQYVNSQFSPLVLGSLNYYEPLLNELEMEVQQNGME